jgi:long-chain acyl-CoA synthetase
MCKGHGIRELMKECNAVGCAAGFKAVELLCGIVLAREEWTPENGLVTPTQKIQRTRIAKVFGEGKL